jgi:hypothetical protein
MKNKNFLFFGMLAIALTFGMTLTGCPTDDDGSDDGSEPGKKVSITGISEWSGQTTVYVLTQETFPPTADAIIAGNSVNITGTSVTVPIKIMTGVNQYGADWTGSGEYYIALVANPNVRITSAKKNFSSEITTVAFSEFINPNAPSTQKILFLTKDLLRQHH